MRKIHKKHDQSHRIGKGNGFRTRPKGYTHILVRNPFHTVILDLKLWLSNRARLNDNMGTISPSICAFVERHFSAAFFLRKNNYLSFDECPLLHMIRRLIAALLFRGDSF